MSCPERSSHRTVSFCANGSEAFILEFSEQVQHLRVVDLVGRPVPQALAWPEVDGIVHPPDLAVAHGAEVGALGEVLADKAVGVLVGPPLPGVAGRAKKNPAPVAASTSANAANSLPLSGVTVRAGWPDSASTSTSRTHAAVCAPALPPARKPLLRSTSVTRHAPAPLPTYVLSSRTEQKEHWELSRVRTSCAHRF